MKSIALGALLGSMAIGSSALQAQVEFERYSLNNGLKVILHEDHSTPIVAVSVLYHVGSKNEDTSRTGFAHFFEHLLFEGSENIGRGEFLEYVQSNGGALNANTSQDRTYYYEILPSNQLKLGLWLESERMLHAVINNDGVETQREVIKDEKRQRIDNQPYASFSAEMFERAFTEHPYRWTPIGSLDHLNAASLEEFLEFYHTFYVPNNATLSIAGDIDVEQTNQWIEAYFADIPAGTTEIPRPEIDEPPLSSAIVDTIYDNIQLPASFWGYRMPEQTHPDAYALEVLTQVLSGGKSSRLSRVLIDEKELALQVFSFPYSLEDEGLFIVLGMPQMGTELLELESGIQSEVQRMIDEPINPDELQKVKNQIETDFVRNFSSVARIAESLANYEVYYGDANLINTEVSRYIAVTAEDIQRVAAKYLVPENRIILRYLPKDQSMSSNAE
jgi:predicted Zn-dependent peptidase